MSLGAFGDEGNVCECGGDHYDAGFAEGWERALERVALMLEAGHPTPGARTDAHALAMTVRAMKSWAFEGRAA